MARRVFAAGSISNSTGAPLRLVFYTTQTGTLPEKDLWTVDGSYYPSAAIPNGIILTDTSGSYASFAGPDDIDSVWIAPSNGAARTQITATRAVASAPTSDSTPTALASDSAFTSVYGQLWTSPAASTTLTGTLAAWVITAVDCTAGAGARSLPAASSVTAGTAFCAKKADTSANNLVVSRAGSDLIYGTGTGATSKTLSLAGEAVEFVSNGTNKWTVRSSDTPSSVLASTYLTQTSATSTYAPKTTTATRYNAKANGCKGDGKSVSDAAMTSGSNVLTSATAAFTSADVGKTVFFGYDASTTLKTTITGYTNATTVTVADNAASSVSSARMTFGTVDSTVLQALITSVAALGGGVIDLDTGLYFAEVTLAAKVTLASGHGTFPYDSLGAVTIQGVTAGATVIDTPVGASSSIAIEGIDILGGPDHQAALCSIGINFRNVSYGAIRRCLVSNFTDQGIILTAGAASAITDTLVVNCLQTRARSGTPAGTVEIRGTDAYVTRSEFNASLSTGKSEAGMNCYAVLVAGNANFFSQCVGEISDGGWYVSGRYNQFVDCRGDLNWGHGWTVTTGAQAGYNMFAACFALNNGRDAANTYDGFKVTSLGNVFSACKNIQNGAGSGSSKYAFEDTSSPSTAKDANAFTACSGDFTTAMMSIPGAQAQTFVASGTYTPPPSATLLRVQVAGGGGGGGGGGSALSSGGVSTQVGGAGGAAAVPTDQIVTATTLTITIGAAGAVGTGGAVNGNAGNPGGNGGDTIVSGSGITTITAKGARGGATGGANSTTTVGGGLFGVGATTTSQGLGNGGFASSGVGAAGGAAPGIVGGAGSGGAPASTSFGGIAGNSGSASNGGATASGVGGTVNGANAVDAVPPGAGGGGGGGGSLTGTGGNGAKGGTGYVVVTVIA